MKRLVQYLFYFQNSLDYLGDFGGALADGLADGGVDRDLINRITNSTWQKTIKAADDAYKPGIFTTFAGYEYISALIFMTDICIEMSYLKIQPTYLM